MRSLRRLGSSSSPSRLDDSDNHPGVSRNGARRRPGRRLMPRQLPSRAPDHGQPSPSRPGPASPQARPARPRGRGSRHRSFSPAAATAQLARRRVIGRKSTGGFETLVAFSRPAEPRPRPKLLHDCAKPATASELRTTCGEHRDDLPFTRIRHRIDTRIVRAAGALASTAEAC
jgi:hypothetical protein